MALENEVAVVQVAAVRPAVFRGTRTGKPAVTHSTTNHFGHSAFEKHFPSKSGLGKGTEFKAVPSLPTL